MRQTTAQELAALWAERRAPPVEGISFADGRTVLLRLMHDEEGMLPCVRRLGRSELSSFWEFNPGAVVGLVPTYTASVAEHKVRLCCGDGGCSAEGFVAVSSLENDRLIWLAFFENSGPFRRVRWSAASSMVKALSVPHDATLEWSFPLAQPELVTVEPSPPVWADSQ